MIIYLPMADTGQSLNPPLNEHRYSVMAGPRTTVGHEEYVAQAGALVNDTGHPNHDYGSLFPSGISLANTAV